jgi:hypothetical protein
MGGEVVELRETGVDVEVGMRRDEERGFVERDLGPVASSARRTGR